MRPAAPPVYRPQPATKSLQAKSATPQARPTPKAPPVYRPQPTPKVLQRKPSVAPQTQAGRPAHTPAAPPVYNPQATPKCLQTKAATPTRAAQARASTPTPTHAGRHALLKNVAQPKVAAGAPPPRRNAAPANAPRASRPHVIQRQVNAAAIVRTEQGAEAYAAFKHALGQMPQQTSCKTVWDAAAASATAPRLDIVFSDGGEEGATVGHTAIYNDYNTPQQAYVIDTLIANAHELQNDTLTIVVNAAVKGTFLKMSAGEIASTMAHEFAVHATKCAEVVNIIRNQTSMGAGRVTMLNRQDELFDERTQHLALVNPNHALHQELTVLIQLMANYFQNHGDADNESALLKSHQTDINEHKTQESWEQLKEAPSLAAVGSFVGNFLGL